MTIYQPRYKASTAEICFDRKCRSNRIPLAAERQYPATSNQQMADSQVFWRKNMRIAH